MPPKTPKTPRRRTAAARSRTTDNRIAATTDMGHSPLLRLPLELRQMIYDELFSSTIANDDSHINHGDRYRTANEWPTTNIDDYISLALVNKEIRAEAIPHFERYFLPTAKLYFNQVPDLYHAQQAIEILAKRNPAYNKMKISLHSKFVEDWGLNERFENFLAWYLSPNELVTMAATRAHYFHNNQDELGLKTCDACGSRLHCFHQVSIKDGKEVKTRISAFRIPVHHVDVVAIWQTDRSWEETMYLEAMTEMQYVDFGRMSKRQLSRDYNAAKARKKTDMFADLGDSSRLVEGEGVID